MSTTELTSTDTDITTPADTQADSTDDSTDDSADDTGAVEAAPRAAATEPEAEADGGADGEADDLGTLMWANPAELVVGINTRTEVRLSAHFVADIRERGVREPITVRRRDDGALVVRKGQRRTLAAVKVGLPRVRVLVEAAFDPTEADRQGQIARIVDQLGENNHRAGIADHEEVAAHQELLELGLTAAQIARQTRTPAARIRQTARVASSEIAARAMTRFELTLDQAAVISEFDDGTAEGIEAVKTLTVCAAREPNRFAHAAQRARNDREDRRLLADAYAEAREQGLTLLRTAGDAAAGEQDSEDQTTAQPLTELRPRVEDPQYTRLTAEDHQDCPGHAIALEVQRNWSGEEPTVETIAYCLDPATYGHAPFYERRPTSTEATATQSEEELAAEKEAARVERKRVIDGNKAWDAAVPVRRDFLKSLLARKSVPNNAALFIATTMASGGHELRKAFEGGNQLACELLGVEVPSGWYAGRPNPLLRLLEKAKASRATQVMLAVALAADEASLHRNSWREGHAGRDPRAGAYLNALKAWGYTPTHVEELVIDPDTEAPRSESDGQRGDDEGNSDADDMDAEDTDEPTL